MLDLVKGETERIDARFLESACGTGKLPAPVLRRKLAAVEANYRKSDFERRHYSLLGLMCIYGIELLTDNITECRANLLEILAEHLDLDPSDDLYRAASACSRKTSSTATRDHACARRPANHVCRMGVPLQGPISTTRLPS